MRSVGVESDIPALNSKNEPETAKSVEISLCGQTKHRSRDPASFKSGLLGGIVQPFCAESGTGTRHSMSRSSPVRVSLEPTLALSTGPIEPV